MHKASSLLSVVTYAGGRDKILAPNVKLAICLATHCNVDNPPHGLRWIPQVPVDCEGAKTFAHQRYVHEAFGFDKVPSEGRLH
jgi:hypothetical protein